MKEKSNLIKIIQIVGTILFVTAIFSIVGLIMLKYEVEGETNMPFELSKIIIVSTAEGIEANQEVSTWNFNLMQNNDIYIYISKNDNYGKTELINEVTVENLKVESNAKVGEICFFKQNNKNEYNYLEEEKIKEKLTYKGVQEIRNSNEITNQGGTIKFRASNMNLAQIISNDGEEIIHNGTILQKANLTENDIKFKISFDVIIKLESGIYFKGKVSLDLPAQEIIEK